MDVSESCELNKNKDIYLSLIVDWASTFETN